MENIAPGHEHIDLVYLAKVAEPGPLRETPASTGLGWYSPAELAAMPLTAEIRLWVELALAEMAAL